MTAYFISDCHLCPEHSASLAFFKHFCENMTTDASSLTILGDFFETYVGDDALTDWHEEVMASLRCVAERGVKVYIMVGNRDFLLGDDFCKQVGAELLEDPTLIMLNCQKALLLHGDTLCTDDINYQRFRRLTRNRLFTWLFTRLSVAKRQELAEKARKKSRAHTKKMDAAIMDVNTEALDKAIDSSSAKILIHGHTHRPTVELRHTKNKQTFKRYVLGDWYKTAWVLSVKANTPPVLTQYDLTSKEVLCEQS